MRRATGWVEREQFYKLHQEGKSYPAIAALYGVSEMSVRKWCRRQRDGGGVENRYYNPRKGTLSQFAQEVREEVEQLKRAHPGWGPDSLRLELGKEEKLQGKALPSRSSIARYVHEFAEFRRAPKKRSG